MAADRVVVVLGGGGVKGLAHIGAWRALEESGVEVSAVVGTSIGSLVGACLAGGMGWRDLEEVALASREEEIVEINDRSFLENGIREASIFRGDRFLAYIRSLLPVLEFDRLELPLSINAVDLGSGRMEWFGSSGRTDVPLDLAVLASCALPLYYPPVEIGGRHYVDGGVLDALPFEYASTLGADLIIAIDVTAGGERDSLETISQGMIAIHHRVFDIVGGTDRRRRLASWAGPPLIYVRPDLDGISTFDFSRTRYFLEEGHRATLEALREWEGGVRGGRLSEGPARGLGAPG